MSQHEQTVHGRCPKSWSTAHVYQPTHPGNLVCGECGGLVHSASAALMRCLDIAADLRQGMQRPGMEARDFASVEAAASIVEALGFCTDAIYYELPGQQ